MFPGLQPEQEPEPEPAEQPRQRRRRWQQQRQQKQRRRQRQQQRQQPDAGAPYYLRSSGSGLYATSEGDFVGVAYEVVRKREGEPRSNRPSWRKPKILQASLDFNGTCDVHVRFYDAGRQWHTLYHRVVAFILLRCFWGASGGLLSRPYAVPASRWGELHVHHVILVEAGLMLTEKRTRKAAAGESTIESLFAW